jgi:hypothetical protein
MGLFADRCSHFSTDRYLVVWSILPRAAMLAFSAILAAICACAFDISEPLSP